MPNIEMHGFTAGEAARVVTNLRESLKNAPYADKTVITRPATTVRDLSHLTAPFLRVYTTKGSQENLEDLERRVEALGFDVEYVELRKFTPKKS